MLWVACAGLSRGCFTVGAKFFSALSSQALSAMQINNKFRNTLGKLDVIVMAGPFPPGCALPRCY